MDMAKSPNRMSIEHILCSPCDLDEIINHSYYGLPSPVSSYDSNDEEDDYDYDFSDDSSNHNCVSHSFIQHQQQQPIYNNNNNNNNNNNDYHHQHQQHQYRHQRSSSNESLYQLHRRAILPYRRRRTHSTNSSGAQISAGQTRRTPWTPDEDMLLKQGYEQGLSWAMIASIHLPHRSRGCCWGRFKTLKNKKFLTVQRQIRAKSKPWKTLNPLDMQQSLLQ